MKSKIDSVIDFDNVLGFTVADGWTEPPGSPPHRYSRGPAAHIVQGGVDFRTYCEMSKQLISVAKGHIKRLVCADSDLKRTVHVGVGLRNQADDFHGLLKDAQDLMISGADFERADFVTVESRVSRTEFRDPRSPRPPIAQEWETWVSHSNDTMELR